MAIWAFLDEGLKGLPKLSALDRVRVVTRLAASRQHDAALADFYRRIAPYAARHETPRVFLSHSHTDKPFVRALARKLESFGLRVWIDEAELKIGDSLIAQLSKVVREVDVVAAILSRKAVASPWVQEELQWALTHQIQRRRVKVLPIVKEPCEMPPFLEGRLFADFSTPYRRTRNLEPLVNSIFHQSA